MDFRIKCENSVLQEDPSENSYKLFQKPLPRQVRRSNTVTLLDGQQQFLLKLIRKDIFKFKSAVK